MGVVVRIVLLVLLLAGAAFAYNAWATSQAEPGGVMALVHPRGANADACAGQAKPAGDIPRLYGFNYGGHSWCFTASFPEGARRGFEAQPHQAANTQDGFVPFVEAPNDDVFIADLVAKFRAAATENGWGEHETVDFVVTFVQSLPYTSDKVTTGADEFVRYPVETLIANGGDCEDTSVLLAALLKEMGYGVVLLSPPGHLAVGVQVDAEAAARLGSVTSEGKHYAYLETTGDGWTIGQVPPEWSGKTVEVLAA